MRGEADTHAIARLSVLAYSKCLLKLLGVLTRTVEPSHALVRSHLCITCTMLIALTSNHFSFSDTDTLIRIR